MHFSCVYESGTSFGTGKQSTNYVAKVTSHSENVTIEFEFITPPQGKSHPGITDAAVKSLILKLSQREALEIAASIITQAHHPTIHDTSVSWIPPEFMPVLPRKRWSRNLNILLAPFSNVVNVDNETKYHIGIIEFEVEYRICDDNPETPDYTTTIRKLVDLPPGDSRSIEIDEADIDRRYREGFLVLSVNAITVTGIVPGKAV